MKRLLGLLLLASATAPAQRNELSLQFGGTLTQRRSFVIPVLGGEVREDNGYAGGVVYRVRVVRLGAIADLMAEIPILVVQATNTDLLPLVARPFFGDTSGVQGFITPGAVLKFAPESRVSPFAFFGAGYARVVEAELVSTSPPTWRFYKPRHLGLELRRRGGPARFSFSRDSRGIAQLLHGADRKCHSVAGGGPAA